MKKIRMSLTMAALLAGCAQAAETRPLVIAHRGASGYLPEHTLAAKAMAHGQGADFIEQDLVLTKDNVPVVLHDVHIDTVTDVAKVFPERKRADGRFYALDFTVAELKRLRLSERFNAKTGARVFPGRFPAGLAEFRIATLEEELQLIDGLNRSTGRTAGIYPELKQPKWHREQGRDLSKVVLPILARYGYATKADACFVQCFEWEELKRIRNELGWKGRLVLLIEVAATSEDGTNYDEVCTPAGLIKIAQTVQGIGPPLGRVVTWSAAGKATASALVKDAHAAGLMVHPYTARSDALPKHCPSMVALHAALFRDAESDGVFTDFPDVTRAWVLAR